jgi:hypothetical protein
MAAKIAPMKIPPQRIALVAIVVVLLAGGAVWWWQGRRQAPQLPPLPGKSESTAVARGSNDQVDALPKSGGLAETARDAEQRCEQDTKAAHVRLFEELGKRDDQDAMLVRALVAPILHQGKGDAVASPQQTKSALLAAAVAAHPDDADVAWHQAMHCVPDEGCERGAAIDRLLELEPRNVAGWMLALGEARDADDEAAVQATMAAAAKASYYDPRTRATFLRLQDAFADVPIPPSCMTPAFLREWAEMMKSDSPPTSADLAMVTAIAVVSAEMLAYSPLRDVCLNRDGVVQPKSRIETCRSVVANIADGDNLIDLMIGESMMVELTAGTTEGARWRERYRQSSWLYGQYANLQHDLASAMRRWTEGEVPTIREELSAKNLWPAPVDWLPDDERARSLILTGRPPPETKGK